MSNFRTGQCDALPTYTHEYVVLRRLKASIYGGSKIITVARGEKLPTADLCYIAFIVVVAALISRRKRL